MERMKKVIKREKGFTLIELLIVIAIIGILAALIIPRVMQSLDSAESTTNDATVKLVQSAVERYYFEENSYPTSDGSLPSSETGKKAIVFDKLVEGGYIDEEPKNANSLRLNKDGIVVTK